MPSRNAQLSVWDAYSVLDKLPQIRKWFAEDFGSWMINLIDIRYNIKKHCCYFICDDHYCQKELGRIFEVHFSDGVAISPISYLRKEILKIVQASEKALKKTINDF